MNKEQLYAAQTAMIEWLSDPHELEPCGHIFSNMQEYNETTAKNECITMVENIMACWKEQAAKYNNQ